MSYRTASVSECVGCQALLADREVYFTGSRGVLCHRCSVFDEIRRSQAATLSDAKRGRTALANFAAVMLALSFLLFELLRSFC